MDRLSAIASFAFRKPETCRQASNLDRLADIANLTWPKTATCPQVSNLDKLTAIATFIRPKTEAFVVLTLSLCLVIYAFHFTSNLSRKYTAAIDDPSQGLPGVIDDSAQVSAEFVSDPSQGSVGVIDDPSTEFAEVIDDLINAQKDMPPSTNDSSSFPTTNHSRITSQCSSDDEALDRPFHANRSRRLTSSRGQVPIAVVGMACRLPGHCNSPQALWDFLERHGIAKNEPPASRFSLSGHFGKHRKPGTMKSPGGMFMEDVDPEFFDGQFFNISRVDCIAMDPQQRQLLEVTYECLENAGMTLEAVNGKAIGCLVGANAVGEYHFRVPPDPCGLRC